ncbi:MAG: 30S ribosomal protein S3 [Thaumarchaeota archaeon]|nr:30S ribosomal protein S3 [Nitrososphaerota archaeon]
MKRQIRNSELDEFLTKQLADAGYGGADIQRTPLGTRITVYVTRPGLVIGRGGVGIKALTEKVEHQFGLASPQISVMEVEIPELNPRIMAGRIAHTVSRGTAFRRAALWAMNSIMNAGAMGVEIKIAGKLRSERSHFEKYRAGVIPKSGFTVERVVRQATADVLLKMGLYGINVKISLKDAFPPEVQFLEPVKDQQAEQTTENAPEQTTEQQVEAKEASNDEQAKGEDA